MRYSATVMDHFMNPRNVGRLHDADAAGTVGSEECGDMINVWIKVRDAKIAEVSHQVAVPVDEVGRIGRIGRYRNEQAYYR